MYLEFLSQYWYLFGILALVIVLLIIDMAGQTGGRSARPIDIGELSQLQSRQNAKIIDLTETDQFKSGHIPASINMPFSALENSLNKITKFKDKPIILVCEHGRTSTKAAALLRKNEFTQLHFLEGGLMSWKKENLPLVKA